MRQIVRVVIYLSKQGLSFRGKTEDLTTGKNLNVCITRWVENIDGWERFSLVHPFLIEMCELYYMEVVIFLITMIDGQQKTKIMH